MILETGPQPVAATGAPPEVASLDDLWRCEYPVLVRLARALVDSPGRAEEIVQDAFAHTLRRDDTLTDPGGHVRASVIHGARGELRERDVRHHIAPPPSPPSTPASDQYLGVPPPPRSTASRPVGSPTCER